MNFINNIWQFIKRLFGFYSGPKFIQENFIIWKDDENELFNLINQYRLENNKPLLIKDDTFYKLAQVRNLDNISKGYITHKDNEEVNRILAELNILYHGENLGYGTTNPDTSFLAWKYSKKGHKENMLNQNWKYSGLAITKDSKGVKYYCNLFGY